MAISQYPAGQQESLRRNRNCLPEIAPQGHFLALRAQGATSACGLLAMTNRGGYYRFIVNLFGSAVQRRERHAAPLQGACGRRWLVRAASAFPRLPRPLWGLAMTNRGGHPRFIDGPLITPVQRREGTARPLQGACGRRGRSVILGCAWRSLSAATDAIGACRFNGTLFQSFVQRRERHAAPLQGACGRRACPASANIP